MANANILFNSPGGTGIAVGNVIQASDFEKDGTLLYDSATGTLYTANLSVSGNALGNVVGSTGSTGAAKMPTGTSAQRPGSNAVGYTRYNTTTPGLELWDGTAWVGVGGGSITVSTTAPTAPTIGALWYDTTNTVARLYVWEGTVWADASPAATGVGSTGATGSAIMPTGTTAQRDATPATGYMRYNTTTPGLEVYDGTAWGPTYTLPTATTAVLGGVKPDGTSITITAGGVISAAGTLIPSGGPVPVGGYVYGSVTVGKAVFGTITAGPGATIFLDSAGGATGSVAYGTWIMLGEDTWSVGVGTNGSVLFQRIA